MEVRLAKLKDIDTIMSIYKNARIFMAKHNNPNQWGKRWPTKKLTIENIKEKKQYVLIHNNEIAASFYLLLNGDPCYNIIEKGKWLNNKKYIAVHSLASSFKHKNIFHEVIKFASTFKKDIRADTHKDNIVMQNALIKEGFKYCGVIYIMHGNKPCPRVAFQKTISNN